MTRLNNPSGIGGWLILPMLGLFILPMRMGVMLYTTFLPLFTNGSWSVLTTPGNEAYHQLWAPLLIFEIAGNILFMAVAPFLLVLLFLKHPRFPKIMIAYYITNFLFVLGDTIFCELIPAVAEGSNAESIRELIRSFVGVGIWVPYFLTSKRVANTFRSASPQYPPPLPTEPSNG